MHKLGSSAIGCEDFSTPGGITNWVSVCIGIVSSPIGYIYIYMSVMKVLCNLRKAKVKQNEITINSFFGYMLIYGQLQQTNFKLSNRQQRSATIQTF